MKRSNFLLLCVGGEVAPFTGAWIETFRHSMITHAHCVAPFTGAWIETIKEYDLDLIVKSRTLHGCVD